MAKRWPIWPKLAWLGAFYSEGETSTARGSQAKCGTCFVNCVHERHK
jgi:hypothetical protein